MEISDLDWNSQSKTKNDSKNDIWDFDLLSKSDADVFDVNFLQSQAKDQAHRELENDQSMHRNERISHEEEKHGKVMDKVSIAISHIDNQSIKDEKLAKLVSAGFDAGMAQQALESCHWDMELAVDMLINGSESPSKEMHSRSPSRQSEVLQAFGMSMFKSAQKVFDYSKQKITQVVESSRSSGWKGEKNNGHETSFSKDYVSSGSNYSPEKPDRFSSTNLSPIEHNIDPLSSASSFQSKQSYTAAKARVVSNSQKVEESWLIADLTESVTSTEKKQVLKQKVLSGNQNLDLLDSSIEFSVDSSKNILNPLPSQFSAQSHQNDIFKTLNNGFENSLDFNHISASQFSTNIPLKPNQAPKTTQNFSDFSNHSTLKPSISQFSQYSNQIPHNQAVGALKATNISDLSSNSSLNRSRTISQKPVNQSNFESLDPFLNSSDLGRSNTIAPKNSSINSNKQFANDFNILPVDTVPFGNIPSITNQINTRQPQFDASFDFTSASGNLVQPSIASSNIKNVSSGGKPHFNQSFMIFDSISDNKGQKPIASHVGPQNSFQKLEADIYKEKGNEFFKSGQYADAEAHYTLGIKLSPGKHPILVALYNNRAGARLKIGSYNEAILDCNKVQELDPNEVKSLLRRAQAYEALEKWDEALADYRKILVIDPSVKSVSQSLARCSKALQSSFNLETPVVPNLKAKELSSLQNMLQPSQQSLKTKSIEVTAAVQYIREKNRKAETEDALKLELKDKIDDKIQLWRKGKEDNLRALLSSLDGVLWRELEWKTINLSEILTPSQVKVKYLKAIGKVHPDKLGSSITVENQLIANSVFSTLNKAWDTFKSQNGM